MRRCTAPSTSPVPTSARSTSKPISTFRRTAPMSSIRPCTRARPFRPATSITRSKARSRRASRRKSSSSTARAGSRRRRACRTPGADAMARYSAPVADIRFALHDVLDVESVFKRLPGFEAATRDVVDAVLDEAAKFTEQVLAPLNQSGDQEGCHFDAATASVTTPAGFKKAYEQYVE